MQDRAVTGTSEDTYLFNLDHFTLAYESKALPEDRARLPDGSEDGKEGIKKTHLAINAFRTGAISGQAVLFMLSGCMGEEIAIITPHCQRQDDLRLIRVACDGKHLAMYINQGVIAIANLPG